MKTPVVIRSILVSKAFKISLKFRPVSFIEINDTAHISLNVLGTPSCLQAVETCRSYGIISSSLQALMFIHLLE